MNAPDPWASYLDPDQDPELRRHMAGELPDNEVAALDRIAGVLADEAVWGGPSSDLRAGLLAQVAAERNDSPTLPTLADRRGSRGRDAAWFASGLVAAAAAVALFLFAVSPGDPVNSTTFEVAGTELTPDLDATVDIEPKVAGVAITLNIKGLGPAGDGRYYAGWLVADHGGDPADPIALDDAMAAGEVVGVGSFHWRQGGIPIELWSGVETDLYPILVITLQEDGGPPTPSDVVVMTARLDG